MEIGYRGTISFDYMLEEPEQYQLSGGMCPYCEKQWLVDFERHQYCCIHAVAQHVKEYGFEDEDSMTEFDYHKQVILECARCKSEETYELVQAIFDGLISLHEANLQHDLMRLMIDLKRNVGRGGVEPPHKANSAWIFLKERAI